MSWRLLSVPMQRAVFDFGWPALWPLQDEAITAILQTDGQVLIAGDTASGKTEAALLPILSLTAATSGFSVLYISPLRALLNDQWERARVLGGYAGVAAHLWHSDVSRSRKARTQAEPSGMLLTTPESLEALCIYRAQHLRSFFGALRFVVVDELHSFLSTERGAQLHSLLGRIGRCCTPPPRRIGLSATVGDRGAATAFLGAPCVVCDGPGPRKGLRLHLRHEEDGDVAGDLYRVTRGKKALIFCNSRARVEHTTYTLNRMAGSEVAYLPHHGSLHLRERSYAEATLRRAGEGSIVCTSSLELGIDVGAVDLVVQVDCTHSVAGLRQRLGRSGRAQGQDRLGQLYTTDEAGLLQTVAVVELMRRGWVEPPEDVGPRYDVIWHQALSTAVERGLALEEAGRLPPVLLEHMLARDHLCRSGDLLIAGLEGERLAHRRDFCAVFRAEEAYEVAHGVRVLGRLPPLPVYQPGTALIFAGRVWTVLEVDHDRRRIDLEPGAVGHPPVFTSQSVPVHDRVREEMATVLLSDAEYPYVDSAGSRVLRGLRAQFRRLGLGPHRRPACVGPGCSEFLAFAGDRVANTLALLLQHESGFVWEVTPFGGLSAADGWGALAETLTRYGAEAPRAADLRAWLMALVPDRALRLPKFGPMLPPALQREMHAATTLDVPGALRLLSERL